MSDLEPRQERFCREYLIDLNATKAAIRAGYAADSASVQGSRLLANDKVSERIAKLKAKQEERLDIKADDVLRELLALATVDVTRAYDETGQLRPLHEIPEDVRKAIAGLDVEQLFEGRGDSREHVGTLRKLKFWDKTKALEMLAKHKALLVEKLEISGTVDIADRMRRGRERAKGKQS